MILFIDDEEYYVRAYIDELTDARHEVLFRNRVDDAVNWYKDHSHEVDVIIVDIMMPPGRTFGSSDRSGGLRTGFLLYEWFRQRDARVPIIVLTNVEVGEQFASDGRCWFFRKENCLPFELLAAVEHIQSLENQQAQG